MSEGIKKMNKLILSLILVVCACGDSPEVVGKLNTTPADSGKPAQVLGASDAGTEQIQEIQDSGSEIIAIADSGAVNVIEKDGGQIFEKDSGGPPPIQDAGISDADAGPPPVTTFKCTGAKYMIHPPQRVMQACSEDQNLQFYDAFLGTGQSDSKKTSFKSDNSACYTCLMTKDFDYGPVIAGTSYVDQYYINYGGMIAQQHPENESCGSQAYALTECQMSVCSSKSGIEFRRCIISSTVASNPIGACSSQYKIVEKIYDKFGMDVHAATDEVSNQKKFLLVANAMCGLQSSEPAPLNKYNFNPQIKGTADGISPEDVSDSWREPHELNLSKGTCDAAPGEGTPDPYNQSINKTFFGGYDNATMTAKQTTFADLYGGCNQCLISTLNSSDGYGPIIRTYEGFFLSNFGGDQLAFGSITSNMAKIMFNLTMCQNEACKSSVDNVEFQRCLTSSGKIGGSCNKAIRGYGVGVGTAHYLCD